jgi:hypothetical protein
MSEKAEHQWSGERRRSVLENAGAEKRRWNPDGLQRRNLRKLNRGLRRGDKHRRVVLLVLARDYQRDRTLVLTGSVLVNAFVKLGRDRKDQREEQRCEHSARDKEPDASSVLVHSAATLLRVTEQRKPDL